MLGELLRIDELTIHYYTLEGTVKAVRGVCLKLMEGESLCLVGESGSGKSTLGLAIAKALPTNARVVSGRILFRGRDITKLSSNDASWYVGRKVAVIFQDPAATFNPLFTIGQQLMDVIKYRTGIKDVKELTKLAKEYLRKVGLPDPDRVLRSYPHELSGGMLQRVAIATALAIKPELLIADEPTTMLDVTLQAQILDLLRELKEEMGLSLLFITHNLGVAAEVCDRVAVMYAGKVVEVGGIEEVLTNPLHPYTRKLLECVPRVSVKVSRLRHIPGTLPNPINPPKGCPFAPRCDEALPKCFEEEPKLIEVGNGHEVACFKYLRVGDEGE